ncbi:MAG TPA: prepilin-type N-terminal cleavage/methylation domain-containing protein [Candidatus Wallbacteria bacterium]|nr:prepilin-type N-terminal cleavage/methylation domain-containing protein [Candidatus Wallbacteria bacterium]
MNKNRRGFSVLEIMIAGAILMLIIIGLVDLLYFRSRSEIEIESSVDLHKNARHSLTRIIRELQESREVLSPINSTAPSAHIMFVNNSDDVVLYFYKPTAKKLCRSLIDEITGTATAEIVLAENIEGCSFMALGKNNRLVELYVKFGILTRQPGGAEKLKTYDISSNIFLRNL